MKKIKSIILAVILISGLIFPFLSPIKIFANENGVKITKAPNINFGKQFVEESDKKHNINNSNKAVEKKTEEKTLTDNSKNPSELIKTFSIKDSDNKKISDDDTSIVLNSNSEKGFKVSLSFANLIGKDGSVISDYTITLKGIQVKTTDANGRLLPLKLNKGIKTEYTFKPHQEIELVSLKSAKGTTVVDFDSVQISINRAKIGNLPKTFDFDINVKAEDIDNQSSDGNSSINDGQDENENIPQNPNPSVNGLLIQWNRTDDTPILFDYSTNEEYMNTFSVNTGVNDLGIKASSIICKQGTVDKTGKFIEDESSFAGDYSAGITLEENNDAVLMEMEDLTSLNSAFSDLVLNQGLLEGDVKISTIGSTPKLNDTSRMFKDCQTTSLNLRDFKTAGVTDMYEMFSYMDKIISLDLSSFDTSSVTDLGWIFAYSNELTSIDFSSWNTSNVTNMEYMFIRTDKLDELKLNSFKTSNVINMSGMFLASGIKEMDLSNFDTSNVVNMKSMFYGCGNLEKLDLSTFNTKNVQDMSFMFKSCSKLEILDLSNFDTSNVTNMNFLFANTERLKALDIRLFDTSNVRTMIGMFGYTGLDTLDVSSFDTRNVDNMAYMFENCKNITELNLDSFTTPNLKQADAMFLDCTNITKIKMNNFITKQDTQVNMMFDGCYSLAKENVEIIRGNWDVLPDFLK